MATKHLFPSNNGIMGNIPANSNQHCPPVQPSSGNSFYNGGFVFRSRYERVDWRKVAAADVEQIARTMDFDALQENIVNVAFCCVENELIEFSTEEDAKENERSPSVASLCASLLRKGMVYELERDLQDIHTVDPNFLKLFKLAQLTIEYLLFSQEYLAGVCAHLEESSSQMDDEQQKLRKDLEAMKVEMSEVKHESHKRKKMLVVQQQYMHSGTGGYRKVACPYCPKAFLNGSFLQAHVHRRHELHDQGGGSDMYCAALKEAGASVEDRYRSVETELSGIRERLQATEVELREEKSLVASLLYNDRASRLVVQPTGEADHQTKPDTNENELEEIKEMFQREIRELNTKYQASQHSLIEMEHRYGGRRSYLGTTLQDDIESEKELLQQQRSEVAELREELKRQTENGIVRRVPDRVTAREERRQHCRLSKKSKMKAQKKTTSRKHDQVVLDYVLPIKIHQELETEARSDVPEIAVTDKYGVVRKLDEGDVRPPLSLVSATAAPISSLARPTRTARGRNVDKMRFIEQLRQNPALAAVREQLREVLVERVEMCGVPRASTGIDGALLLNKTAMQQMQRKAYVQRYPNFCELRDHFNNVAHEQAVRMVGDGESRLETEASTTTTRPGTLRSARLPPTYRKSPNRSSSAGRHKDHTLPPVTYPTGSSRSSSAPPPTVPARLTPSHRVATGDRPAGTVSTDRVALRSTDDDRSEWPSMDDSDDALSGIGHFSPPPKPRLIHSVPREATRTSPHLRQPTTSLAQRSPRQAGRPIDRNTPTARLPVSGSAVRSSAYPGSSEASSGHTPATSQWGSNSKEVGSATRRPTDSRLSLSPSSMFSVTDLTSDDELFAHNI